MVVDDGFLLASDLHETPKARDAYRWQIFGFLTMHIKRLVWEGWTVPTVVISGDLTDSKDRHPAALVDPMVQHVTALAAIARVFFIEGNHDYIDDAQPFFGFLGDLPNVTYIKEPGPVEIGGLNCLCLPHRRDWSTGTTWRRNTPFVPKTAVEPGARGRYDYLIAHQTFAGSMASNGDRMEGVPLSTVSAKATNGAPVLSGDIHVPQKVGNVTYVGSPHPVCFGDDFEPRILFVRRDSVVSIPNPTVLARHKFKLSAADVDGDWPAKIFEGDQVKVDLVVSRADALDVGRMRARVKSRIEQAGGQHFGTDVEITDPKVNRRRRFADIGNTPASPTASPDKVWAQYCQHRQVPAKLAKAGVKYL